MNNIRSVWVVYLSNAHIIHRALELGMRERISARSFSFWDYTPPPYPHPKSICAPLHVQFKGHKNCLAATCGPRAIGLHIPVLVGLRSLFKYSTSNFTEITNPSGIKNTLELWNPYKIFRLVFELLKDSFENQMLSDIDNNLCWNVFPSCV